MITSAKPCILLLLAVLLVSGSVTPGKNILVEAGCQSDIGNLISKCESYVQKTGPKIAPSEGCCGVVQGVDMPCVCGYVTKSIESIISMEKVVYVARTCGKVVPSGTHCGSYVVPRT
ncbi:hypothetical protein MLD38_004179 [Melastoma candidum]|uniref:Uncharacterized protein n=1 Tax=Melastoma candidum TaxID=119954 RepID=A0ACB9S4X9_9MYRT|nr:hypothetical protein MLD38_004179 [Melastoma candidum]